MINEYFFAHIVLGYAIIQLPELVPLLYRWMKDRAFRYNILFPRKASDSNRMKKLESLGQGHKTRASRGKLRDVGNSLKPCEESILPGRLAQLELQVTSNAERINNLELRLLSKDI